jgi:phosphohistidine phosphatase
MPERRLILLRHATAANGSGRDIDRSLTRRGLDEARRVGERLRAKGPVPTRALVSSARRCRETWQGVANGLGLAAGNTPGDQTPAIDVELRDALYDASTTVLLETIHAEDEAETLLVLAHNPGISLLALELGRARPRDEALLREGFAPATLAVFEIEGDWRLLSPMRARLSRFERAPAEA